MTANLRYSQQAPGRNGPPLGPPVASTGDAKGILQAANLVIPLQSGASGVHQNRAAGASKRSDTYRGGAPAMCSRPGPVMERSILQLANNGFPALSCIDRLTEVAAAAVREAAAQLRGRPSCRAPLHVPHVRQHFNWDCGLACVLMILRALGVRGVDFASLRRLCPTTSVWTVDLAHLLRQFGMGVVFLTTMVGANPEYANELFYAENMAVDEERVHILFQEAPAAGIPVHQRSLASAEVKACMMSGLYLMLMLVDKSRLGCWPPPTRRDSSDPDKHSYTGHYIVVCSYSSATDRYTIRDPAASFEHIQVTAASLDSARTSYGTDEDLLLISTRASSKQATNYTL